MRLRPISAAAIIVAGLSISHSAQALPMCPGKVYYQGECVTVSDVVTDSNSLHALLGPGATEQGTPGKTLPTRPVVQSPDLRKDLLAIREVTRSPEYAKMVAIRDIAGLAGLFGRRGITIAPLSAVEVLMCKPPYGGVPTWGWHTIVTPTYTYTLYGEYCGPGTTGSQTG